MQKRQLNRNYNRNTLDIFMYPRYNGIRYFVDDTTLKSVINTEGEI